MILLNSVLACMITLLDVVYFFLCKIHRVFILPGQELLLAWKNKHLVYHTQKEINNVH
jgi:hypothetical protein